MLHIAEFGVVLLLFVIGLELQPSRLRAMRKAVFGLGLAQVLVTTAVFTLIALALGPAGERSDRHCLRVVAVVDAARTAIAGRATAAQHASRPLRLRDPAVPGHRGDADAGASCRCWATAHAADLTQTLLSGGEGTGRAGRCWSSAAATCCARCCASSRETKVSEAFTAAALLVVLGTALLVDAVGMSMALGAFVAGLLLADSEYRHELEADIEPFKGLLLGLFFMSVGMTANLGLLLEQPGRIALLVAGLVAIKFVLLYALRAADAATPPRARAAWRSRCRRRASSASCCSRWQSAHRVMDPSLAEMLVIVVTISMIVEPAAHVAAHAT